MSNPPLAVAGIDIGTNSLLLAIARDVAGRLVILDERCVVTRLGEGLADEGSLSRAAIERTLAVLEELALAVTSLGARARAVGTSALRRASNAEELLVKAGDVLGFPVEVLSGAEEARLTYRGSLSELPGLDPTGKFHLPGVRANSGQGARPVVVDIGGGSTEVHDGDSGLSLELGAVRLTEAFLSGDPPSTDELSALRAHAGGVLREALSPRQGPVVLSGGTATTLAAIAAGLDRYDPAVVHGYRMSTHEVVRLGRRLASMTVAERQCIACLPADRADVIAAGALLLADVLGRLGAEESTVSDRGLRFGLIEELLEGDRREPA